MCSGMTQHCVREMLIVKCLFIVKSLLTEKSDFFVSINQSIEKVV